MKTEHHHCRVLATPWEGVYATHIESARHYGRHWHATYGLGLLEQGAQHSASGRGAVDAYAGDIITTNPGEVHDGRPLGGPTRRWQILYFDPELLNSGEETELAFTRPVIHDAGLRQSLQRLFVRLAAWRSEPGDAGAMACDEALVDIRAQLRQRHAEAVPERSADAGVAAARERLADEMLAPPTLAELAAEAGLSRYQLLRRFEKRYGVPPHAWLLQQRVECARGLIRGGTRLVEAAAACGFADQSHMTRLFVRQFGFTPGAWQRACRLQ